MKKMVEPCAAAEGYEHFVSQLPLMVASYSPHSFLDGQGT